MYTELKTEKTEAQKPLKKCRCRWERNAKHDLGKIGRKEVDWIQMTQGGTYRNYKNLVRIRNKNSSSWINNPIPYSKMATINTEYSAEQCTFLKKK
jgi:hypothetical protein